LTESVSPLLAMVTIGLRLCPKRRKCFLSAAELVIMLGSMSKVDILAKTNPWRNLKIVVG
jgi:hypothetical protein